MSNWGAIDALAAYLFGVKLLIPLLAAVIAVSGLDDLFVDLLYLGRLLYRKLFIYSRFRRASARDLADTPERWMAILLPAWDEADVIGSMLTSLTERLAYDRYRVFVGVYPNDPRTSAAVKQVADGADGRIILVTTAVPGPTTKADCLNALWRSLHTYEDAHGLTFAAIALHDAEDLCHPHELKVFNHLIDRLDMIQLPVMPLPQASSRWVAGHYLDDFAEAHAKDMVVREALGAAMPCAGVGCAFARPVLEAAAARAGGAPFNAASVTEDYVLGIEASLAGSRPGMVRMGTVPDSAARVATQAYFPDTLEAAVRQKARWLAGIALQGWARIGWQGSLADRYMLFRDRKALITAYAAVAAYAVAMHLAVLWLARSMWADAPQFPPLIAPHSFTAALVQLTLALLVWRLTLRALLTARAYGWREGLYAVPRAIIANGINFLAASRAIRLMWRARRGRLAWDKTAHRFPDAETAVRAMS